MNAPRYTVTDHQHQVHAECNLHIRKRTLNSLLEYQVIHEIFSRDIFTLFLLVRIHEIREKNCNVQNIKKIIEVVEFVLAYACQ